MMRAESEGVRWTPDAKVGGWRWWQNPWRLREEDLKWHEQQDGGDSFRQTSCWATFKYSPSSQLWEAGRITIVSFYRWCLESSKELLSHTIKVRFHTQVTALTITPYGKSRQRCIIHCCRSWLFQHLGANSEDTRLEVIKVDNSVDPQVRSSLPNKTSNQRQEWSLVNTHT